MNKAKIEIEINNDEIFMMLKEEWYQKARLKVKEYMDEYVTEKGLNFINAISDKEFLSMFEKALENVLKRYKIRDLESIQKLIMEARKNDDGRRHNQS